MSEIDIGATAKGWLRTAHTVSAYVDVYNPAIFPGGVTHERYSLQGGQVTMDGLSMVRTTAALTLEPAAWETAQLWPQYGSQIVPTYVIGPVDVVQNPVLVYFTPMVIETAKRPIPGAQVEITCSDRMRLAEYDQFPTSYPVYYYVGATKNHLALLTHLLEPTKAAASPLNSFGTIPALSPQFIIDSSVDRLKYLRDEADNLLNDLWINRKGEWQSEPITRLQTVQWVVDKGDKGVMLSGNQSLGSERTRNCAIVFSEMADGRPPVWAVAQDNDPASPTYVGGQFGRRTYRRSSGFLQDVSAMQNLANVLLGKQLVFQRSSDYTIPPAPQLDPLDLIIIKHSDTVWNYAQIQTIAHDLAGGPCKITIREEGPTD